MSYSTEVQEGVNVEAPRMQTVWLSLLLLVFSIILLSVDESALRIAPVTRSSIFSGQHASAPQYLSALNGSALLRKATFSTPFAQGNNFDPFTGLMHGLGYQKFSPTEALQCIARVGGLGLVGDSMVREVTTVFLEYLGRPRIAVMKVAWENQRADEIFDVTMPDGSQAQARLFFRFAKNAHPELTSRISEMALSLGVRAIVAHSQFWDFHLWDTPATASSWLSRYMALVARCLEETRNILAPQLAALDAGDTTLPPRRWLWRTGNPTVQGRLDEKRATFLPTGFVHASNAFVKAALKASSESGGWAPQWTLLDMWDIIPPGMDSLIREDGYHPVDTAALSTIQVILNQLCGEEITQKTLTDLILG